MPRRPSVQITTNGFQGAPIDHHRLKPVEFARIANALILTAPFDVNDANDVVSIFISPSVARVTMVGGLELQAQVQPRGRVDVIITVGGIGTLDTRAAANHARRLTALVALAGQIEAAFIHAVIVPEEG